MHLNFHTAGGRGTATSPRPRMEERLKVIIFRALDDFVLNALVQPGEIRAEASHADHQVAVILRLFLRVFKRFGGNAVELGTKQ